MRSVRAWNPRLFILFLQDVKWEKGEMGRVKPPKSINIGVFNERGCSTNEVKKGEIGIMFLRRRLDVYTVSETTLKRWGYVWCGGQWLEEDTLGKHSCISSTFHLLNGTWIFPTAQLHVHKRCSRRDHIVGWRLSNFLLLLLLLLICICGFAIKKQCTCGCILSPLTSIPYIMFTALGTCEHDHVIIYHISWSQIDSQVQHRMSLQSIQRTVTSVVCRVEHVGKLPQAPRALFLLTQLMCAEQELVVGNSWFKKNYVYKYTWLREA